MKSARGVKETIADSGALPQPSAEPFPPQDSALSNTSSPSGEAELPRRRPARCLGVCEPLARRTLSTQPASPARTAEFTTPTEPVPFAPLTAFVPPAAPTPHAQPMMKPVPAAPAEGETVKQKLTRALRAQEKANQELAEDFRLS